MSPTPTGPRSLTDNCTGSPFHTPSNACPGCGRPDTVPPIVRRQPNSRRKQARSARSVTRNAKPRKVAGQKSLAVKKSTQIKAKPTKPPTCKKMNAQSDRVVLAPAAARKPEPKNAVANKPPAGETSFRGKARPVQPLAKPVKSENLGQLNAQPQASVGTDYNPNKLTLAAVNACIARAYIAREPYESLLPKPGADIRSIMRSPRSDDTIRITSRGFMPNYRALIREDDESHAKFIHKHAMSPVVNDVHQNAVVRWLVAAQGFYGLSQRNEARRLLNIAFPPPHRGAPRRVHVDGVPLAEADVLARASRLCRRWW